MDLHTLRREVENQIATYQYEVPKDAVGRPLKIDRVDTELNAMRTALVDPYWADVELRDTAEQINSAGIISRKCAVVADDRSGNLVAFDPIENEFLLAIEGEAGLSSIGVRGDAVGCFMAR